MSRFSSFPIRRKLSWLMILNATAVAFVAICGISFAEVYHFRQQLTHGLETLAKVVGQNSRAAILFNDLTAAQETLNSVEGVPSLVLGALYDQKGRLLVQYARQPQTGPQAPSSIDNLKQIEDTSYPSVFLPIKLEHEHVGYVYLRSNLDLLRGHLITFLASVIVVFCFALVFNLLFSARLQRLVSDRILQLTSAAREVSLSKDYSVRVQDAVPDDLGMLASDFNTMLSEIERRDESLLRERNRAEAATRAKSHFLANVSHEIRTPLNGVIGIAELLQDTPLNSEQQNFLRLMTHSARSLLSVINDVLDISKIEQGKLELRLVPFGLRERLALCTDLFRINAEKKGLRFEVDVAANVPDMVIGDADRLIQILTNILGNALKFTERGLVALSVKRHAQKGPNIELLFSVRDTGIGITLADQALVFEPFEQADVSRSRVVGGTGLGLSISRRLVQLMHGNIWLESVPDQGTEVFFTAQFGECHADTHSVPSLSSVDALMPYYGTNPHVLVVEDNAVNQMITERILQKLHCSVTIANNGKEALEILARENVDIVLMDLQMPVLDGFETTRKIRAQENSTTHLPIIALTAHAMEGDREKCFDAGMDGYITKPVAREELERVLAQYLSPNKRLSESAEEAEEIR